MNPVTTNPSHRPTVVQPLDGEYDAARRAWNLAADLRPAGVVTATTVEQIREALALAAERGMRVAAIATGHSAGALPPLDGALLVRAELHAGDVEIDPVARTARVQAGAVWEDVVDAAARHGLAALHGSSPDVGVVGYLLAGGLSFYGRRYGVAANHVRAIELVTVDGDLRRVADDRDPELFWALRGGSGAFGVVTAIEFDLFPIERVFAGALCWPLADARAVLRAWTTWAAQAPEEITTALACKRLPPVPAVPEPLRGVPAVSVDGVLLGDRTQGDELLAPLRAAAPTILDSWTEMDAAATVHVHGDPRQPVPLHSTHALLDELDEAGIDAFLGAVGEGSETALLKAELRQLGGALATVPAGGGATAAIPGSYLLFGAGTPTAPGAAGPIGTSLNRLAEAMRPWTTGRTYLAFAEDGGSARPCFDVDALARLARVREAVDPAGRLLPTHAIS